MFNTSKEQTLLHLARAAIAAELGFVSGDLPRAAWLEEPAPTFVTLTVHVSACTAASAVWKRIAR